MRFQVPWFGQIARLREQHAQELADARARHAGELADQRALYREEMDRANRRLELANGVAIAMAKQAQSALDLSRKAVADAGETVRAAAHAVTGPAIPDELPEPDSIGKADRRIARERRAEEVV